MSVERNLRRPGENGKYWLRRMYIIETDMQQKAKVHGELKGEKNCNLL